MGEEMFPGIFGLHGRTERGDPGDVEIRDWDVAGFAVVEK